MGKGWECMLMRLAKGDRLGVWELGIHVTAWEEQMVFGQVEAIKGTCTLVDIFSGLDGAWVQTRNPNEAASSSNPMFTIFKFQIN